MALAASPIFRPRSSVPRAISGRGLGLFGFGFVCSAAASVHERGFLPLLLTSSLRTSLALNDSTRRDSMVIGSPV